MNTSWARSAFDWTLWPAAEGNRRSGQISSGATLINLHILTSYQARPVTPPAQSSPIEILNGAHDERKGFGMKQPERKPKCSIRGLKTLCETPCYSEIPSCSCSFSL